MKLLIRFALLTIICASPLNRDATGLRRRSRLSNKIDNDISIVSDMHHKQMELDPEKEASFVDSVELDPETPCSICTGYDSFVNRRPSWKQQDSARVLQNEMW
jgi:hypothetical protein